MIGVAGVSMVKFSNKLDCCVGVVGVCDMGVMFVDFGIDVVYDCWVMVGGGLNLKLGVFVVCGRELNAVVVNEV